MCDQHIAGFADLNYHYKSEAIQVPQSHTQCCIPYYKSNLAAIDHSQPRNGPAVKCCQFYSLAKMNKNISHKNGNKMDTCYK